MCDVTNKHSQVRIQKLETGDCENGIIKKKKSFECYLLTKPLVRKIRSINVREDFEQFGSKT